MTYFVYRHTSQDGKAYIGFTGHTVERRLKAHLRDAAKGSETPFHVALREYGEDAFTSEVLGEFKTAREALDFEIEMIALHNTMEPNGYNVMAGGGHGHGPAWRRRVAEGNAGNGKSEANKAHLAALNADEGIQAKISESNRSPERRAATSAARTSDEGRAIMRVGQRKRNARPGESEKRSLAQKTRLMPPPLTPELRAKLDRELAACAAEGRPVIDVARNGWVGVVGRTEFADLAAAHGFNWKNAFSRLGSAKREVATGMTASQRATARKQAAQVAAE